MKKPVQLCICDLNERTESAASIGIRALGAGAEPSMRPHVQTAMRTMRGL